MAENTAKPSAYVWAMNRLDAGILIAYSTHLINCSLNCEKGMIRMNENQNPARKYTHDFVEAYPDLIAFGWDRKTDEQSLICYLQMFSDDTLMKTLVPRLTDSEITDIQEMIQRMLKTHCSEAEYHGLFLKDGHL
jgi:hypothetical protein